MRVPRRIEEVSERGGDDLGQHWGKFSKDGVLGLECGYEGECKGLREEGRMILDSTGFPHTGMPHDSSLWEL